MIDTVADPDPYPTNGGQLPNPNECNSILTSETRGEEMVKCGLWRKLSLLSLLWHANTVDEN